VYNSRAGFDQFVRISAKSDIKDAITLANLTREGKYIDTVIEDGVSRQLRTLSKVREKILRQSTGAKNTLHAVLDDYFPELKKLFYSMHTRGLWAVLETCSFPEDVLKCDQSAIAEIITKASRSKTEGTKKARALYLAAQTSIGLKRVGDADRYRLRVCLNEVKQTERILQEIKKEQIIKYAGYDPQESDSGKRVGRKAISKKGRWLLRKYLYLMSVSAVNHSKFFRMYYQRRLKIKNRFGQLLKKKEALCAVAIKLIKVIFALLRDKREFQDTVSFALAA
jgi:transposase